MVYKLGVRILKKMAKLICSIHHFYLEFKAILKTCVMQQLTI
jgi:hypothetical protein